MDTFDYKTEREKDLKKIINSIFAKKVILAGPGTGKSTLFKELIGAYKSKGKKNFLAITFMGKLCDLLSDDLCGLAETTTIHSFAKNIVESSYGWGYYPKIYEIIKEDLKQEGVTDFAIGDENYKKKSSYYGMVGHDDVIFYALEICKNDQKNIPNYDLILIDEFQDFNKTESEFVDILSSKNDMVIVGDDDQALYTFRGSSPDFIRDKYSISDIAFESHTLRFCYRCTDVLINYFHNLLTKYSDVLSKNRVNKDYICYLPLKEEDNEKNNFVYLKKQCPPNQIAFIIRNELREIVKSQKINDVLIIGEPRSCEATLGQIARTLNYYGFKNVEYENNQNIFHVKQNIVDAYKFIGENEKSLIGWRILNNPGDNGEIKKHIKNAKLFKSIIDGTPSKVKSIGDSSIFELKKVIEDEPIINETTLKRELFIKHITDNNRFLPRPLIGLNMTICNVLKAKGLGADVVFLIGFDQGRFPVNNIPSENEVYQMLVSITRAKKRVYLINSKDRKVSSFIDCIDKRTLKIY